LEICSGTTWKVNYNSLNLWKRSTEGFLKAIFVSC
jgi:hypothetical protein